MIKINLYFILVLLIFNSFNFTSVSYAQSRLKFCDSTNRGWNNDEDTCITPCDDLKVDQGYPNGQGVSGNLRSSTNPSGLELAPSKVGYCQGTATKFLMKIYRIDLGTSAGFNGKDKCTIFNRPSNPIISDIGNATPGQTLKTAKPNFEKCTNGATFDRVYLYYDRKIIFAGHTNYPDSSGKIARTNTSQCTTDSLNKDVTNITVADSNSWLDEVSSSNWGSSSKCYGQPSSTTGVQDTYLKANQSSPLVTTNYSSSSDVDVEYDDWKNSYNHVQVNGIGFIDGDFYAEDGGTSTTAGFKLNPENTNQIILLMINGGIDLTGFPLKFEKKKTQKLELNYYGSKRGNVGYGLKFAFRRNGTVAEFLGVRPNDNGLFITISQF